MNLEFHASSSARLPRVGHQQISIRRGFVGIELPTKGSAHAKPREPIEPG
jgi:hypothetical protein